ncbi:MAG TPA: hypothetical protein DCS45_18560 [Roseovarius nubinhibens]|uniref:Uncharacterized protein n=1 Tax=Roseovarius nubinhibens TaxID=314263 RepID=A0A348WH47_9RHOB|nr:hypothetical protein [Roseovarius nubinhibens]
MRNFVLLLALLAATALPHMTMAHQGGSTDMTHAAMAQDAMAAAAIPCSSAHDHADTARCSLAAAHCITLLPAGPMGPTTHRIGRNASFVIPLVARNGTAPQIDTPPPRL